MAGDANVVEQPVQLADDGGDLLGQIGCVHGCGAWQRLLRCSSVHAPAP
jgi:hypothetical protein